MDPTIRLEDLSAGSLLEFRRVLGALMRGRLAVGQQVRILLTGDFLGPDGDPRPEVVALAEDAIRVEARPFDVLASIRGKWANLPALCCDLSREASIRR